MLGQSFVTGLMGLGAAACSNGPYTRQCWDGQYGVWTNYDLSWPTTGVTRSYNLEITNTTCAPDGAHPRQCLLVNNRYPGPTIYADWGDMIQVNVVNKMQDNGTSMHWHGIRQYQTNMMDGTNGITQCPIAPGQSMTYTFQATQHGTFWYHSHYESQYGDGVLGPIVINGPTSANYDHDLGPLTVTDWTYETASQFDDIANDNLQKGNPPPPLNTILVNGTMVSKSGTGSYGRTTVVPGTTNMLRLISTSTDNIIRVSIDDHKFWLVTSDAVPIHPLPVTSVLVNAGQRYNIIFEANQPVKNYWLRATPEKACGSINENPNGRFIIHYEGAPSSRPTTTYKNTDDGCVDPAPLTPFAPAGAGNETEFKQQAEEMGVNILKPGVGHNNLNVVTWGLNLTDIQVSYDKPTLSYVMNDEMKFPKSEALIKLPNQPGMWTYWVIQEVPSEVVPLEHPLHLHGHDFSVLGRGTGQFKFSSDSGKLNFENPTRRDSVTLPKSGWLVLSFQLDNPGAWLFHCHNAAHISQGMGVQFLEQTPKLKTDMSSTAIDLYKDQCSTWDKYWATAPYKKGTASGLRRRSPMPFKA